MIKHDEKKIEEMYDDFNSFRIALDSYIPAFNHKEKASNELLELYKTSKQYAEQMVQQERERNCKIVESMMEDDENWKPIINLINKEDE